MSENQLSNLLVSGLMAGRRKVQRESKSKSSRRALKALIHINFQSFIIVNATSITNFMPSRSRPYRHFLLETICLFTSLLDPSIIRAEIVVISRPSTYSRFALMRQRQRQFSHLKTLKRRLQIIFAND